MLIIQVNEQDVYRLIYSYLLVKLWVVVHLCWIMTESLAELYRHIRQKF